MQVRGWPGHVAGQHVDVRLTADDGYTAQRSYSLAAPPAGDRVELTVQRITDGEVSPYLVDEFGVGDQLELRGPIGGWFVWTPAVHEGLLLVAGGAGIVPLMAMIRARAGTSDPPPCRLLYSVRAPADVYYAAELRTRTVDDHGLTVSMIHTRTAPAGSTRPPGRLNHSDLAGADATGRAYVCGPTGFVEHAADLMITAGYPASSVRTERFGPSGG